MLKRAVINVQSKDNAYFAWSVVAALHPTESHVERESSYFFPDAFTILARALNWRFTVRTVCAIRLPSEDDKWLEFKNHCRKERVPFVVYADLECALEKTAKDPTTSTYTYQHHNVFSIGYYMYCSYDNSLSGYCFHRDKDCISWFADELKNLAQV
ncbi:hypothetical protein ALC62_02240 [Cyphomyrmex costatus]|uniref:Uncharacterized protein n=1 Tax=Cyphomyrmex costatus TaxID=456900 RepID=A0A195D1Y5_9HYME|nr:hypothetical protein ALC62_02240 [Cyphomyrmex costatus]